MTQRLKHFVLGSATVARSIVTALPFLQMAQEERRPSAAEKGKGKVDDLSEEKGTGKATAEKDGKATANGKIVDGLPEGEYIS